MSTNPSPSSSAPSPDSHYDLALLDVDGTLRHMDRWNAGALDLVTELHEAGVHVALCSGRTTGSLTTIVADMPHVEFVASSSGATVLQLREGCWEVLAHRALPREAAETALDSATAHGVELWAFTARDWLVPELTPWARTEMQYVDDTPVVTDLRAHVDEYGKILFLLPDPTMADDLRAANTVPGTSIVLSGKHYLDLVCDGAHDAKGGDLITEALGIDWSRTIAVGDSENDRGMLSRAGLAVCVPPIRAHDLGTPAAGQLRLDAEDTMDAARIIGEHLHAEH